MFSNKAAPPNPFQTILLTGWVKGQAFKHHELVGAILIQISITYNLHPSPTLIKSPGLCLLKFPEPHKTTPPTREQEFKNEVLGDILCSNHSPLSYCPSEGLSSLSPLLLQYLFLQYAQPLVTYYRFFSVRK